MHPRRLATPVLTLLLCVAPTAALADSPFQTDTQIRTPQAKPAILAQASASQVAPIFEAPSSPKKSSGAKGLAKKISFAGALILTADQLVRSVDSVLGNMRLEREDGTCLWLDVDTDPKNVGLMLQISCPLGK